MRFSRSLFVFAAWLATLPPLRAVTSPKEFFGSNIGDDHHLVTYTQMTAYFRKLVAETDRLKMVEIGRSEEGRTQYMLICSSPRNLQNVERYRRNAQKLAQAEDLSEEEARRLSTESLPIVWIDGGLHAAETVGAQQLIETVWQFASRTDAETRRILDRVVILFANDNPDGMELVSSWYMRNPDPQKRIHLDIPRLYHKYAGHDNNRDFLLLNLKESGNLARVFYVDWRPQIIYNHHQSSPAGSVVAGPPYRDPFNVLYDPMLVSSLDTLGAAMVSRLNIEGKPGYTRGNGAPYNGWRNGGLRNTAYYHNQIGLLTEMTGHPTPMAIPLVPERLAANFTLPNPIEPQQWHFRSSIEYSVALNYAVLNHAVRHGDELLYNIYKMGRNSIERGSRDHWTLFPRRIREIPATTAARAQALAGGAALGVQQFNTVFRDPKNRDPRAFVIPADQKDFPTALKFVNALIKSGVVIHRATAPFALAGKQYPAGSLVVKTAQANRPHVIDMFEPTDHPVEYSAEGIPVPPFRGDGAGWTLSFQMGVQFDRILDAFDAPLERLALGETIPVPAGKVSGQGAAYRIGNETNNGVIVVNRLLKAKVPVRWQADGFYVAADAAAGRILRQAAIETGVGATAVSAVPSRDGRSLKVPRIALVDLYGGLMPSGWIRWLLEQYEFGAFDVLYPQQVDAGTLREKYDVVILPDDVFPNDAAMIPNTRQPAAEEIPAEYRAWLGNLSNERSVPALREFMNHGGTVIAIGTGTQLAQRLGLPVKDAQVETDSSGKTVSLPRSVFHVPGSLLIVKVDTSLPVAAGLVERVDVNFDNSPTFILDENASAAGIRAIASFDQDNPLRAGWAWGQERLKGKAAAFQATVGQGQLYCFGPDITFRALSHSTFKLLFNGVLLSASTAGVSGQGSLHGQ